MNIQRTGSSYSPACVRPEPPKCRSNEAPPENPRTCPGRDGITISDEAREDGCGQVNKPVVCEKKGEVEKTNKCGKKRKCGGNRESMRKELRELRDLLDRILGKGGPKKGCDGPRAGGPGERRGEGGQGGCGRSPAAPVGPTQGAQPVGESCDLDSQLTKLAMEVLQGDKCPRTPQQGGPCDGKRPTASEGGRDPQDGMMDNDQGLSRRGGPRNGSSCETGIEGSGGARKKLSNLYFQSGGMGNCSLRPQTHKLVQIALGIGSCQPKDDMATIHGGK